MYGVSECVGWVGVRVGVYVCMGCVYVRGVCMGCVYAYTSPSGL